MVKMKPKILIGEMAKLHNISAQTLRYYDNIGLFKPLYKDEENNYRYYGVEQFAHLDSILFLKRLGVSLDDIQKYFNSRNLDSILLLLEDKERLINKEIKLLQERSKSVQQKLKLIHEYRKDDNLNQCTLKFIQERKIIYLDFYKSRDIVEFEYGLKELSSVVKDELCLFNGIISIVVDKNDLKNNTYDQWKGLALIFEHDVADSSNFQTLPEGNYAAITFMGSYEQGHMSFHKLNEWIKHQKFEIAGDGIALTITDAAFSNFESEYITEIQIPVKNS